MAWTVILENEKKELIVQLNSEFNMTIGNKLEFKLLCYLDPYGDTIFNRLQMDDLIKDLRKLENNSLINEIYALVERCKKEEHLYLGFYGD